MDPKIDAYLSKAKTWKEEFENLRIIIPLRCATVLSYSSVRTC
jgi:uncharacterized protein YdeI (YjbR/CyaY-like superfamily)